MITSAPNFAKQSIEKSISNYQKFSFSIQIYGICLRLPLCKQLFIFEIVQMSSKIIKLWENAWLVRRILDICSICPIVFNKVWVPSAASVGTCNNRRFTKKCPHGLRFAVVDNFNTKVCKAINRKEACPIINNFPVLLFSLAGCQRVGAAKEYKQLTIKNVWRNIERPTIYYTQASRVTIRNL